MNRVDSLRGLPLNLFSKRRIFLFQLFRGETLFSEDRLPCHLMHDGLNLLLCFREESRHLSGELQRCVRCACRRWKHAYVVGNPTNWFGFGMSEGRFSWEWGSNSRRQFGRDSPHRGESLFLWITKPVFRWKGDAPGIPRHFQFQRDLKQLTDSARPLNPGYFAAYAPGAMPGLWRRHFQVDPHVFQDVVLGLVAAPVTINDEGGGSFGKGAAQGVHAHNIQRYRLHDPGAAALA